MTTWIGSLGAMVPTLCASDLPRTAQDRWAVGGGAGTLAPTRHLMLTAHGPGAREWGFSRGVADGHAVADLASLARAQARTGRALRFVPCDAGWSNMLTPGASEELAGWTGTFTAGDVGRLLEPAQVEQLYRDPGLIMTADLVMTADLEMTGPHWATRLVTVDHETWGTIVTATGTIVSPTVPLLGAGPWPVLAGLHVRPGLAPVTVTLEAVNAAGLGVSSVVRTVAPGATIPTRSLWEWTVSSTSAVGWRVKASSSASYYLARPSLAQTHVQTRWVPGAAADAVVLSPLSVDPLLTLPGHHLTSVAYTVREDGV